MATNGRGTAKGRGRGSGRSKAAGTGGPDRPVGDGRSAGGGQSGDAGRAGRRERPPMQDVDLRVQLPYFLIRLAALVVLTVVLAVVGVNLLLSVLIGFAVAGLLTWPLGRMQRRAAQRAAAARGAAGPPPPGAGKGKGGSA